MKLSEKLKDGALKVRTYWRTPPLGRYMPFKEIAAYSVGGIGAYFLIYVVGQLSLNVNNFIIANSIGLDSRIIYIIYIITVISSFPFTAVRANIIDNVRNKKGKYRPYLITMGIPTCLLTIGFVMVPYEKISSQVVKAAIVLLFNIGFQFFYMFYYDSYENLLLVLSPNTQERTDVASVKSVIYSLAPSIATAVMPFVAKAFTNGDMTNLLMYRIGYPPMAIIGVIMSVVVFANTQEKIVQARTHVARIKFMDALRSVARNKYFWIISLAGWLGFLEGSYGVILQWLYQYKHACSEGAYAIIGLLYGNASLWGMLAAPFAIRKWGKKRVLLFTNFLNIVFIAAMYPIIAAEPKNMIWMVLGCLWLNGLVGSFAHVLNPSINGDIRDYQQYVTGERIDGMFSTVGLIGSVITMATSGIIPFAYNKLGINSDTLNLHMDRILQEKAINPELDVTNIYNVLYVDEIFDKIMLALIGLSVVGAIMNVLPYFFYDMTENKQRGMVKVLQIRAMFEDYGNGVLRDKDIVNSIEIIRESREYVNAEPKKISKEGIKQAQNKEEKKKAKKALRADKEFNNMIEISKFVNDEMLRFTTNEGLAQLKEAREAVEAGYDYIYNFDSSELAAARRLPNTTEQEKAYRKAEITRTRDTIYAKKTALKNFPDGIVEFDNKIFEALFAEEDAVDGKIEEKYKEFYAAKDAKDHKLAKSIKVEIAQLKIEKKKVDLKIKDATNKNSLYVRATKPFIDAKNLLKQCENYNHFDEIAEMYEDAKVRHIKAQEEEIAERERLKEEEKAYAAKIKAEKAAKKGKNK